MGPKGVLEKTNNTIKYVWTIEPSQRCPGMTNLRWSRNMTKYVKLVEVLGNSLLFIVTLPIILEGVGTIAMLSQ